MWRYLLEEERRVLDVLEGRRTDLPLEALKAFHERQIGFLQHERLVHLHVTLAVAVCVLLASGFAMVVPSLASAALALVLLALFIGYLVHYYRLENGVQRLYLLSNRIDARLGSVPEGTLAQP